MSNEKPIAKKYLVVTAFMIIGVLVLFGAYLTNAIIETQPFVIAYKDYQHTLSGTVYCFYSSTGHMVSVSKETYEAYNIGDYFPNLQPFQNSQ